MLQCHLLGVQGVQGAEELGRIRKGDPVLAIRFDRTAVHYDRRTYTLKGDVVSLSTLPGRITAPMMLGPHQRRILESGQPEEADLVFRRGKWFFNLVVESGDVEPLASDPVISVDVGENHLAATSTGKVFGGGLGKRVKHRFACEHCVLRTHCDCNASRSLLGSEAAPCAAEGGCKHA